MRNGFSMMLCIGKYGGFYARFNKVNWRVCLGWIAFTIYPTTDIEEFIQYLRRKANKGGES